MAIKVFLDTNIVIDFFEPVQSEHEWATTLFSEIEGGRVIGYLSESVLNTCAYILRKQYSTIDLREILFHLLSFTKIISCNNDVYLKSLSLPGNDIEDAVLYGLALEKGLNYFITSDKKDFKKFSSPLLPVATAKEFMKIIT